MMRTLILTLVTCLLLASVAEAQVTQKGNFVFGSALGISTAKSNITLTNNEGEKTEESPQSTQYNIAPAIGYFLFDDFSVGIRMDYTFNKVNDITTDRVKDSDLLFGPFARYYLPIEGDIALMLEAGFGFGNSNDEQLIGESTQKINTNIFAIGFGPGITIISDRSVGLEAVVKYNFARSEFDTSISGLKQTTVTKTNQLDLSIGLSIYFSGVQKPSAGNFY